MSKTQRLRFIIICMCAAIAGLSAACYRSSNTILIVMIGVLIPLFAVTLAIFLRIRTLEANQISEERSTVASNN